MGGFLHVLVIPIVLVMAAIALKSSELALFRKTSEFRDLDEHIQAEIERTFRNTLSRLAEFEMDLPTKIVMQRMENEEGNTFNDPFLVGNSHEVRAYHYVSEPLSEWCSGVVSRNTRQYFEHKNRRIHVTFDCNRTMAFPPLRTLIGYILIGLFINAAIIIFRMLSLGIGTRISSDKIDIVAEEKRMCYEEYLIDDDMINNSTFMERFEKWETSKCDSVCD